MNSTPEITCEDCGACCATMCSPLLMPEHIDATEINALPADVRKDFKDGMEAREKHGWIPDVPCFWLTDDLKCKHYEHRPDICREFEVGSEACQTWRDEFNIDVELLTGQ